MWPWGSPVRARLSTPQNKKHSLAGAFCYFFKLNISGCGSAGRAGGLGPCLAVIAKKIRKSRKAFTYADFRHFKKTQKSVDFEFDHNLSHFHAKTKKLNKNRGVAQLGARDIWDVEAAGSNPVTPTIKMT